MPESSLAAAYADLEGDVGFFLGFGRGARNSETAFTTKQQATVDRCIKGGLRNFYFCGFAWSFLRPVAQLTLASAAEVLDLPDDFGGLSGQLHLSTGTSADYEAIDQCGLGRILHLRASYPDTTGRPTDFAIEPIKGTSPTAGQRFRLAFYPTADQAYTVRLQYYLLPDFLSGALPYVYGGVQHAETVLESCLAVAEKVYDDAAAVHAAEFEKRLAISKELDRFQKVQKFGYNADRSDGAEQFPARLFRDSFGITFNGVTPG